MKIDFFTKAILTIIAVALVCNIVSRPAKADDATLNGVSDQVASVGDAVDKLQASVDDMQSDITDIKNNQ